jgi:tripartite-type tricarboxylate transporter receptor subunit TctC
VIRSTSSLLHHLVRVINPSIYAKLPYNTENDFAPITMVASTAILMAVHPNVG